MTAVIVVLLGSSLSACGNREQSTAAPAAETTIALAPMTSTSTSTTIPPQKTIRYVVKSKGQLSASLEEFGAIADQTYADPRGWSQDGRVAFARVESGGDFTLWLSVASSMSSFGGACMATYSCRNGDNVVINETRWREGGFLTMALPEYRQMVLNHETGHWFGLDHETCSGTGNPAYVMQQQSKGGSFLGSCVPNPWPLPSERNEVARQLKLR